jgi:polysaccharide pyruvyl transferase WcaK-like protein
MTPKKFAIIGGSIWGNRGAAAMLETTIGRLREYFPDAEFAVFTPYPLKDKALVSDPQLEFFDSRPIALLQYFFITCYSWFFRRLGRKTDFSGGVKALIYSDVLLDIGGITFSDGRLIFLPYNILTILPSLMFDVPVVKLSQAAGPFTNPLIRMLSRFFLSRCAYFFARGEKTLVFLTELGLDPDRLGFAADVAFSYKPEYSLTSENSTAVSQLCAKIDSAIASGHKIITIAPSVVVSDKMSLAHLDYVQLLANQIKRMEDQDVIFVVFPNASREGSKKTRNNDLRVIEFLRDKCETQLPQLLYKRMEWVTFDVDTRGIEEIIKRADVLIASRFHAMVFGLKLGIPTVVIGWGHKYKEVMSKLGQDMYVLDYSSPADNLTYILREVLKNKDAIASKIKSLVDREKASSCKQFDYLVGNILE